MTRPSASVRGKFDPGLTSARLPSDGTRPAPGCSLSVGRRHRPDPEADPASGRTAEDRIFSPTGEAMASIAAERRTADRSAAIASWARDRACSALARMIAAPRRSPTPTLTTNHATMPTHIQPATFMQAPLSALRRRCSTSACVDPMGISLELPAPCGGSRDDRVLGEIETTCSPRIAGDRGARRRRNLLICY
jgi:hypothetical protein